MNVELISYTPGAEELCGKAAAVCMASDRPHKSLQHAFSSGHNSVLEHAVFTFQVEGLSRAALAQLTRHRLASFDVQSQRYVRIHGIDLVIPESIRKSDFYTEAGSLLEDLMNLYQRMVDAGIPYVRMPDPLPPPPKRRPGDIVPGFGIGEFLPDDMKGYVCPPDSVYDLPGISVGGFTEEQEIGMMDFGQIETRVNEVRDRFVMRMETFVNKMNPEFFKGENISKLEEIITCGYNQIMKMLSEKAKEGGGDE